MMMFIHAVRLASAALACVAFLTACGSMTSDYEGVLFLETPEDVSAAWLGKDGSLLFVPEKGVVIDAVVDDGGRPVSISVDGAYLRVQADRLMGVQSIKLQVERRWRVLSLPGHQQASQNSK